VEFALIVPAIVLVLLSVLQVGLLVYGQLSVTFAAREAVRIMAVDPTADPAQGFGLDGSEFEVAWPTSDRVQVIARQDVVAVSVLFAPLLEGRTLEAVAAGVVE